MGISLFLGLSYNYLFYPHTLVEFVEAGSIGLIMGLIIGILEEYVLKKTYERMSSLAVTVIRSLLYAIIISAILAMVLSIEIAVEQGISYYQAIVLYLQSPLFRRDLLFSLSFIVITLFLLQLIQLIGLANFLRLFMGRYRKPREVTRIFMFLDLTGSTSIAEKLGNKLNSALIRDFFNDVSDAIILFRGEIYQFAGDKVIVVWPLSKKSINAIRCFFKMQEITGGKTAFYTSRYGLVPEFKAAIHVGEVVVTTVGKQKKEIVYHGDVLNTTARIEGKCNDLEQELLVSEDVLPILHNQNDYLITGVGNIELKGKSQELPLYGVQEVLHG